MRIFILVIMLFACLADCVGQNTLALPQIVNYSKETIKAGTENWAACQDNNGLIYFANNEGLLCFDGTDWRLYPLPNKTIVRSVAVGKDNKIFVGGQDEIGYFAPDKTGQLTYTSLTHLVPAAHRSFSDVWDIVSYNNQVFFRSNPKIFLYSNEKVTVYPTSSEWKFLGDSHNRIIAQDEQLNLLEFSRGSWQKMPAIDLPPQSIVTALIESGTDSTMIVTLKNGIYLLDGNKFSRIKSPGLDKIASQSIYTATRIDLNHFVLGTALGGVFILDKKGDVVQQFSRREGLQNNNIICAFSDRSQNLWLGLNNGIDYIAYSNPVKNIRPDYHNPASGYSSVIHNQHLYIATSAGLYAASLKGEENKGDLSLVKAEFMPVKNSTGQVWNLSVVNDQLFIGHHEGAFRVTDNVAVPIDKTTGFWTFQPLMPVWPSPVMIAGTYKGINFYDAKNKQSLYKTISAPFESSRFVTVDENNIWVSHPYKGVFRIYIEKDSQAAVELYAEKHGLTTQNNYIFKIKNRLVATTDKGIYEYNSNTNKFEPSSFFEKIFGRRAIRYLKEDAAGNVWFVYDKNLAVADFSNTTPEIIYISELDNKLVSGFEQVYPFNDNNVFVGAEKGFFHINYSRYKQHKNIIGAHIREVRVAGNKDSVLYNGYAAGANDNLQSPAKLAYQWNSIHFNFSAPVFEHQSNIKYSCYLEGYDQRWSDWSAKTEKEYAYLPAGRYKFFVKTRNSPGNESEANSYSFVILPPWYQTWWAVAIYVLLLFTGAYFGYRWQKKKFVRQQLRYEEKQKRLRHLHQLEIEKNEKEIVKLRNEKLEAEINHKNKEVASATMHLVKKGELIAKIKEELQRLTKNTEDSTMLEAIKKMVKALGEDENMDADWELFAIHFDKVHNDFFIELKKHHRNLTPTELKLCAYLRMNLCTKEMARLMNISVRGVEISRYRLRKKLKLATETNLTTYLLDLHSEAVSSEQ